MFWENLIVPKSCTPLRGACGRADLEQLEGSGATPATSTSWELPKALPVEQGPGQPAPLRGTQHLSWARAPRAAVSGEVIAAASKQRAVNLQTPLSAALSLHLNQLHQSKKKNK